MGQTQKCPDCGSMLTRVVMTKGVEDGGTLRRRHCRLCDKRWYSYQDPEILVTSHQIVWRHRHYVRVLHLDETRKAASSERDDRGDRERLERTLLHRSRQGSEHVPEGFQRSAPVSAISG